MFRQVLYTQLKWTRVAVALVSVLGFIAPSLLWRTVHGEVGAPSAPLEILAAFSNLGPMLAVLAFLSGFLAVAQPYAVDASARHVYALSLPIPWRQYVALRFGAGAVLLALPALALLLGSLLVLAFIDLPDTLHAYPVTLAARFLLGSLVAYAIVFAVQYVSGRKAASLLLVGLLALCAVYGLAAITGNGRALAAAVTYLFNAPGPLAIFGSDWMLIDV